MANLICITIDCKDAKRLGTFWAAALDGYMTDESGMSLKSETGPTIYFQQVTEGKESKKNRLHLDLGTNDREAEIFRLTRLGAKVIEEKDHGDVYWTIMQDPEGNEFCVTPMP